MTQLSGDLTPDYAGMLATVGVNVRVIQRETHKIRSLTEQMYASKKEAAKARFRDDIDARLRRVEGLLQTPELTQNQMAKRDDKRQKQQEVLEGKCWLYREALEAIHDHDCCSIVTERAREALDG